MMKYLWIGPGMGERTKNAVLSKGGKLLSAYVSQTNLVEGLDALGLDMDTLNGPKMDEKLFPVVRQEKWSRNGQSTDIFVGYKNIKYLNRISKEHALCKAADDWLNQQNKDEPITIIVYNMHTAFLATAYRIKTMNKNTQIVLIVPDLPQYMDLKQSSVKQFLKNLDWKRIQKYMCFIDKFILYSEHMASFLNLPKDKCLIMEGSYNCELLGCSEPYNKDIIVIMYSGTLDLRYGIPELLDAMELLEDNYELWLTGDGNARSLVEEKVKKDPRIKFLGYLPSRQDLLNKQATATMLISPRRDTEGSKYCFPSKILEYMASGRPVISCYLGGIPDEYHSYLVRLKEVSAECIADTVKKVASMNDVGAIGEKAKTFVLETKNKYAQAKKIIDFVKDNVSC